MGHPRARVALEERGRWVPGWLLRYLYRPLFPVLEETVAEGGLLIYETFMQGNEKLGRPRNPDHLLKPGELLGAFPGLSVVAFEQGEVDTCGSGIVQRIVLSKDSAPRRLDL